MRTAICLIAALAASSAYAQPVGTPVDVIGCPSQGVEAGCVILRTIDGRSYNISGARPTPPIGANAIRVIGVVSGKVSFCMQGGPVLDPVQYTPTPIGCAIQGAR